MHPRSDVDVGIIPADPELPPHAELELRARLERALGRPVDLVRLDRATTLLRWRAALEGVPVLEASPVEHKRFVAEAAIEHAELAPALERAMETFRRRLAAGGGQRGA